MTFITIFSAQATVWHVNITNGNDNTGNGSLAAPYHTINKAITVALKNDNISVDDCGTTIENATASNALLIGATQDNLKIYAANQGCVRIKMNVSSTNSRFFYVQSDNVTIDGFVFDGHGGPNLDPNNGILVIQNTGGHIFRNNVFVNLTGGTNNAGVAFQVSLQNRVFNTTIINNTCNVVEDYCINFAGYASDIFVQNNTCEDNASGTIECLHIAGTTAYNNSRLFYQHNKHFSDGIGLMYGVFWQDQTDGIFGFNYSNFEDNEYGSVTRLASNMFPIRVYNIKNAWFDREKYWFNDTTTPRAKFIFELNSSNITINNIMMCNASAYCSSGGSNILTAQDAQNFVVNNFSAYLSNFGDGIMLYNTNKNGSNVHIRNSTIISSTNASTHLMGIGEESGDQGTFTSDCSIVGNTVVSPQNFPGSVHSIFTGGVHNCRLENNRIIGGTYGPVIKLSYYVNTTNNTVINQTLTNIYDKGSLFSNISGNYVDNNISGNYLISLDGTGTINTTNASVSWNIFNFTGNISKAFFIGALELNSFSDSNIYQYEACNQTAFYNAKTALAYNYSQWWTTFNLENNSAFICSKPTNSDSTAPLINFTFPTENNKSILTTSIIRINVTAADLNLRNITIYLYNSSSNIINSSTTLTSPNYIEFNVSNGFYYFDAFAYDIFGNVNNTLRREVTVNFLDLPKICVDDVTTHGECTLYTPHMNCGQLNIYNTTNFILNSSLLNYNENISYYVFNQTAYTAYIIKFCDNTTKYVVVGAGDDSMTVSIVIGLTVFIALFIILAIKLENVYLQLVSAMMAMGFSWVLYALLLKIAEDIIQTQSVIDVLVAGYKVMVYSYIVIFTMILLFMVYKLMLKVAEAARGKK